MVVGLTALPVAVGRDDLIGVEIGVGVEGVAPLEEGRMGVLLETTNAVLLLLLRAWLTPLFVDLSPAWAVCDRGWG